MQNAMKKKEKSEVYITHVLFPWETFAQQEERESREIENDGARWTDEFIAEVRQNIERYAAFEDLALRNSLLTDVYKLVPVHFRNELFAGISWRKLE